MKYCYRCGTQLPENSKFCPKCGAPTGVKSTRPTPAPAPVQPEPTPAPTHVPAPTPEPTPAPMQPKPTPQPVQEQYIVDTPRPKSKAKVWIIIGSALVTALVVLGLIWGIKSRNEAIKAAATADSIAEVEDAERAEAEAAEAARLEEIRQDSIAKAKVKENLYQAMEKALTTFSADDRAAAFSSDELNASNKSYLMTDLDGDGLPEMWVSVWIGPTLNWHGDVYYADANGKLVAKTGEFPASGLKNCGNYVLSYYTYQGMEEITKWTLSNGKLSSKVVYDAHWDGETEERVVDTNIGNLDPDNFQNQGVSATNLRALRQAFGK